MPRFKQHKKTEKYSNEFKSKAVRLSLEDGVEVQAVAKSLALAVTSFLRVALRLHRSCLSFNLAIQTRPLVEAWICTRLTEDKNLAAYSCLHGFAHGCAYFA